MAGAESNQIKSNLFDNTNKSKHKQMINGKQIAINIHSFIH